MGLVPSCSVSAYYDKPTQYCGTERVMGLEFARIDIPPKTLNSAKETLNSAKGSLNSVGASCALLVCSLPLATS